MNKLRKRKVIYYKNKRILMYSILGLFLFLGMGYSVLNTNLNILGNITVKEYVEPTLYNVLRKEAETNGLAKEYTGEHGDSMDSSLSTKKIYHWYAPDTVEGNTLANEILDKNNVVFAGQCWQMIRTTDTGGVKMIYNGEAENSQCLNTRGNHVGYGSHALQNLSSNYWYGTDYTYDSTNQVFSIAGTTEQVTWSGSTSSDLIGKYTCGSTTKDGTCSTLYLIESYFNASYAYVFLLNSNSHYSQYGTLEFNGACLSLTDVGYMYNTRYAPNSKTMTNTEKLLEKSSLETSYWYAHDVVWGNPIADEYNLDNPYQINSTTDYPNLVGEYTFEKEAQTYTRTVVDYITAVDGSNMYYIPLDNSGNHTLSDFNYTYTYGESFIDNGDETYTINNAITINRSDWYTSYNNVINKYVCKNAVNDTCSDLWYTTATSVTDMTYIKVTDNYKYSKSFTWDGSKYVLDNDTSISLWNITDSTNQTSINNAHYTCWNKSGECTTISYIYNISGITPYYINIADGKSVDDAKNEMLYNDDVNTTNSTIKIGVDAWYKKYLLDYDDVLEDTIFCSDRSQNNQLTNGWNPNSGDINVILSFHGASDLRCTNITDQFSVSNSKARLTYKIGLISTVEMDLLNNRNVRKTGKSYWLFSPSQYSIYNSFNSAIKNENGNIIQSRGATEYGVRPAISLVPGTEYSSGDGSMTNPYIVSTN